jgi:hypothetical protein
MSDIAQPETVAVVQRRLDGQSQGGKNAPRGQPLKKVAATYQEAARTKPLDDRITILGIPIEQITPMTQAALAGLVAESNHLRNIVKRYERAGEKRAANSQFPQSTDPAILEPEAFLRALGVTLGQPTIEGNTWVVVLIHVATYEDIRRSFGLLAANGALAEVAYRLKDMRFGPSSAALAASIGSAASPAASTPSAAALEPGSASFVLLGYAGGSNLAGAVALPAEGLDAADVAKAVRTHLSLKGYVVGGIDMALAIGRGCRSRFQ